MKIAEIILDQLGGNKFIRMTGARNLVGDTNSLSFKLPSNFAMNNINYIQVRLNSLDLYDIDFCSIKDKNYKCLKSISGIYCDQLQEIFTSYTGLQTKLF
jgi:hypothetical protein